MKILSFSSKNDLYIHDIYIYNIKIVVQYLLGPFNYIICFLFYIFSIFIQKSIQQIELSVSRKTV